MKASPELEEIARICGDEITESLYLTLTEEGLVELHHSILSALQQVVSVQVQQVSGIKEAQAAATVEGQKALSPECVLIGCVEGRHVAHCPEWEFHNPQMTNIVSELKEGLLECVDALAVASKLTCDCGVRRHVSWKCHAETCAVPFFIKKIILVNAILLKTAPCETSVGRASTQSAPLISETPAPVSQQTLEKTE